MSVIVRRGWRQNQRAGALVHRLAQAGCPISFETAIRRADAHDPELSEWVRTRLAYGLVLRTSQAEHLALGHSLTKTSRQTGISVELVLYYLTFVEEDDPAVVNFFSGLA